SDNCPAQGDPEIALVIFDDRGHGAARQPVPLSQGHEASSLKAAQRPTRCYPYSTTTILIEGAHPATCRLWVKVEALSVADRNAPVLEADPNATLPIAVHGSARPRLDAATALETGQLAAV